MCKKHFHDAKSWPLCCISPAPGLLPSHSRSRSLELLNFQKSEIAVTHIQILIYYSTFIQTKVSQSKSFRDQDAPSLICVFRLMHSQVLFQHLAHREFFSLSKDPLSSTFPPNFCTVSLSSKTEASKTRTYTSWDTCGSFNCCTDNAGFLRQVLERWEIPARSAE